MKNNITDLRKAKGLSMAALAERTETSQQQIDRLEKGKRKLTVEWIEKLCSALDCKAGELVDFSSDPTSTEKTIKSKVSTASATIIGAIETGFSNMVRMFDEDETYQVSFRGDSNKKYFGLIVEGAAYGKHPENTELIFSETGNEDLQQGMAEGENNFISADNTNKHRFVIGDKIISADLVKSIRSE